MSSTPGSQRLASVVAVMLVVVLVGAMFRVGIEKKLDGTIGLQEWGRYLFGIGSALTKSRWGIGGYVIDQDIEKKLQSEGLTDNPALLRELGFVFPDNLRDERLMQRALEQARNFNLPPPANGNYDRLHGSIGDDVGIASFTTLAFWLFGTKISSLYYTYFVLLCATILLCVLGHYRSPAAMAGLALMALSLYVLFISDLVNFTRGLAAVAGEAGSDIKNPRFFGTIAAFPALHLILTWIRSEQQLRPFDLIVLAAQAVILAFVIQIRWPTLWLLFAIYGYWIIRAVLSRRFNLHELCRWRSAQSLPVAAVYVLIVSGGIVLVGSTAHPLYRLDGDLLHHPFWPNLMEALEANPDWDAKYLQTVNGVKSDEMPREIARQEIAKLPPDQRPKYMARGGGYPARAAVDEFTRARFFDILRKDPWFILHTFLFDQPKTIFAMAFEFYLELIQAMSPLRVLPIIGALAIIVWTATSDLQAMIILRPLAGVAGSLSLIGLLPLLIAAPPHQLIMIDHFLWFLYFLCLLTCLGGIWVVRWMAASASPETMNVGQKPLGS